MEALVIENRTPTNKGAVREIRRQGKLPGVLYGLGHNKNITIEPTWIHRLLLKEGGRNQLLTLKGPEVDGKHAIIKDYQVDPVTRVLLHVDLLEIDVTKTVEITVKLNVVGKSLGVQEGGVLNYIERTILVRCLPTKIPNHIDVDVSALKIGDSIHLNELNLPEGLEKVSQANPTLIAVVPPTKEEEATAVLAPTAEPEVITAKKEAPGEEGAAPAAAAGGDKEKKEEKKK